VVAIFPFASSEDGDLPFNTGDSIEVLDEDDSGWWKGRIGSKEGIFPGNYTK